VKYDTPHLGAMTPRDRPLFRNGFFGLHPSFFSLVSMLVYSLEENLPPLLGFSMLRVLISSTLRDSHFCKYNTVSKVCCFSEWRALSRQPVLGKESPSPSDDFSFPLFSRFFLYFVNVGLWDPSHFLTRYEKQLDWCRMWCMTSVVYYSLNFSIPNTSWFLGGSFREPSQFRYKNRPGS